MRGSVPSNSRGSLAQSRALSPRHLRDLDDLTPAEFRQILKLARRLKRQQTHRPILKDRLIGLVFEKPSLRTRLSFEAAITQLGGRSTYLTGHDVGLGSREDLFDVARVASLYVSALVVRAYEHRTLEELARAATVPVINGLSDRAHPCQALGDALTIQELFGEHQALTVTFVGDGNNVARSLAIACSYLGWRFRLCAPPKYAFDEEFIRRVAQLPGTGSIELCTKPEEAVRDTDVLYTDVWTSMGQEKEAKVRRKAFLPYQVNAQLLALAPPRVRVMHCLPAHRGEEITDEVLDGPQSVVLQQAENRLHGQKALLAWLFRSRTG
jgi:ornithine carbamoyltransferase